MHGSVEWTLGVVIMHYQNITVICVEILTCWWLMYSATHKQCWYISSFQNTHFESILLVNVLFRTVACQSPLSMDLPGKNTGVGCNSLLQGIFLTKESNLGLPHCRQTLYHLSHQGSPLITFVSFKLLNSLYGNVDILIRPSVGRNHFYIVCLVFLLPHNNKNHMMSWTWLKM